MKTQKQRQHLWAILGYVVMLFVISVISAICLSAQEAGGTIVGVVTDSSGGAVTTATVTIRNVGTGVERTVSTNSDGVYVAPNLIPGSYEVHVDAAGFAASVFQGVVLTVGETHEINAHLSVGQVTQNVTVTSGDVVDVQLASSAINAVVEEHTVVDLPLNGRDWTSLSLLQPGVAQVRTQSPLGISNQRANRGLGTDITIGGNRPQQNNYRLDGVSINDYSSGPPGSILGTVLGVDAVQEFSVVTSNAPADYGKTAGGVINAASRSGTNALHGTAYEFLRNQVFDARNFFDPEKIPDFRRNQFGASAGGPIIKNHTFFFADYEGLRQSQGITNTDTVPSQSSAQLAATNSAVLPYLALFPKPNFGAITGTEPLTLGTFRFVAQQITDEDFVTGRIDHKLSASDSLFGTYLFDKGNTKSPDIFDFKNIGTKSRRHTVALEESHIFTPTVLNIARFGFNRDISMAPTTLNAIDPRAADSSLGFDPGHPVGLINVGSGITNFQGGLGAVGEYDFHYNSFQVYDDLNWTKSKHSLKFGFAVERMQSNQLTRGVNPDGQFIFGGLQAFLANQPTSFNSWLSTAITPRDLRQSIFGGYIQDDFKFRPNLTLNIGLRYEVATVPTEAGNRLSTIVNLTTDTNNSVKLGSPYFSNPTHRDFDPRVGFSWDPFGTGKTSIHGAFGIYDVLPLPYQFELISLLSQPFAQAGNVTYANAAQAQGQFPKSSFSQLTVTTLRNGYVEQNPRRSYVEQWTFNVQRELFPTFTVTVGYLGSHGVHLPFHADEINDVQPTLTAAGWAWPAAKNGTRLNPNVGQISAVMWSASSNYHAFDVDAIKRLSHGVQFQGSYTFSKSIDTSSSGIAGDTFGNSVSSLPVFDPRLRRGLSDFDVRNLLSINALWMIPSPAKWSGIPRWTASGWQLGGIYTLGSGLPFTPTIGGDPLGLNGADLYAFPDRGAGCNPVNSTFKQNPGPLGPIYLNTSCFTFPTSDLPSNTTAPRLIGNSGRNTVPGPGLDNLDFSLFKNNPIRRISESFNVQFRWEVFNILNQTNFNPPTNPNRQVFNVNGALNAKTAGLLTSPTATSSREMQFALKLIW